MTQRKRIRGGQILGVAILLVGIAQAQPSTPTGPDTASFPASAPLRDLALEPAQAIGAPVTSPEPELAMRPGAPAQDVAAVREDVRALRASLTGQLDALRPAWWERLVPAIIGLLGVFVGGFFGWLQQGRQLRLNVELQQQQLRENERVGRAKAGFESLSKVIDFQTRQVNEFYSPLRLMLRRSEGVRRQLCDQLRAQAPSRLEMRPEADGREHLYVKEADGSSQPFRLIRHMYELATRYRELMPLVEEIVNIGIAMTELINTKGGMAITGSEAVNTGLGRYLAHFSILRDVAVKAKANPALLERLEYNVAYPRELDGALDADMAALAQQIDDWKALSRRMWAEASQAAPATA